MLAALTGGEVVCHARGGARLSEQLNPNTRLGARTQAALAGERWDYVVLQEMSHGPITAPKSFFSSVERLCGQIRANGAVPGPVRHLGVSERRGQAGRQGLGLRRDGQSAGRGVPGKRRWTTGPCWPMWAAGFTGGPIPGSSTPPDGVHPSELGSRMAAETIADVIRHHKEAE